MKTGDKQKGEGDVAEYVVAKTNEPTYFEKGEQFFGGVLGEWVEQSPRGKVKHNMGTAYRTHRQKKIGQCSFPGSKCQYGVTAGPQREPKP